MGKEKSGDEGEWGADEPEGGLGPLLVGEEPPLFSLLRSWERRMVRCVEAYERLDLKARGGLAKCTGTSLEWWQVRRTSC